MVTREQVRDRLTTLISEIGKIPLERINERATVDEDIQISSLAFIELQVALEEEYQIQVDPIRVVELNEFGAIVDYIHGCAVSAQP